MKNLFEDQGAEFSPCKKYRYALWRIWDHKKPLLIWIGLNPSTANKDKDDPTIESVRRISIFNGYGGFYMMNLYAIISAEPKILKQVADPVGDNMKWHIEISAKCNDVVFAWGNFKEAIEISKQFVTKYPNAFCIRKNKNLSPVHPLFQKRTSKLKKYNS